MRGVLRAALAAMLLVPALASTASAAQPVHISYHEYTSSADFSSGTFDGTQLASQGGAITLGSNLSAGTYVDPYGYGPVPYRSGSWTSPWYSTGFGFTELVSSWNADTPPGTWLEVDMQAVTSKATDTKWYVMGIWAFGDETIHRTSVGHQGDADGFIAIDTFFAKDHPMSAYRLKATLYRTVSTTSAVSPTLRSVGAVASDVPNERPYVPSALGGAEGIVLDVPQYSQEIHAGEYPQFDGGGEAWCSPTSTEMVVEYWGQHPSSTDLSEIDPSFADPQVDFAAKHTYDYHYQGTGNWPFNTAYAARYGLDAFVTQLHSLNEAEQYIKAGIPLVASLAFQPNKLDGFLFKGTNGHLLVIRGFTASGDVVTNDPASKTDAQVRQVYDREQFERAWLRSTGGIVYVIHPSTVALPALGG